MTIFAIIVKAAVTSMFLWLVYEMGKCSAVHDIVDYYNKKIDKLPEDIQVWIQRYDKKSQE